MVVIAGIEPQRRSRMTHFFKRLLADIDAILWTLSFRA